MIYEEAAQPLLITDVVNRVFAHWLEAKAHFGGVASDAAAEVFSAVVTLRLSQEFVFFKAPAFAEEREWRVAKYRLGDDVLHTRVRNGLVTPYLDYEIGSGERR